MDTLKVCPVCNDTGWKTIGEDQDHRVSRCDCWRQQRNQRLLDLAGIPKRYEDCSFSTYIPDDDSQQKAKLFAERFAALYPVENERGLLFVGTIGVGKTHLAVSIAKALILNKGIHCLFCDYRELLKHIQDSYNPESGSTELGILRPIFDAEVLILDELGAVKPSEWVWNTVSYVLNTRYNDQRTTIITTNFPNAAPAKSRSGTDHEQVYQAAREETLGDRIGERMRSRLQEMCVEVEMTGKDFRAIKGKRR